MKMSSGKSSNIIEQRGIYLIKMEFTDGSGMKPRPVVAISKDSFNATREDFIACPITKTQSGDGIKIDNSNVEDGRLDFSSKIKSTLPHTFNRSRTIKKIGKLKINIAKQIVTDIREVILIPN